MVVVTALVSACYMQYWSGDWWLVLLSIDIQTGGHVCGVRNLKNRSWSGWVGTWRFLPCHTVEVAFDTINDMPRWQIPLGWLKQRVTLISRCQLANFPQVRRYMNRKNIIVVPVIMLTSTMPRTISTMPRKIMHAKMWLGPRRLTMLTFFLFLEFMLS